MKPRLLEVFTKKQPQDRSACGCCEEIGLVAAAEMEEKLVFSGQACREWPGGRWMVLNLSTPPPADPSGISMREGKRF